VIRDSRVAEQYSNDSRWETIFTQGMKPYFQTIRDVNWYMNSLAFQFSQFLQENTFEVNPVDLIALEAIRVFEGEVYRKLYGAKLLLTSLYFASYNKELAESLKKDIFDSAYNKLQIQTLLKSLFPLAKWESDPLMDSHEDEKELLKTLRVGHPDNFGRYFNFTIPEDEISQADVERLINHSRNKESLLNEFRAYKKRGLLGELLERLKVNLERVDFSDSIIVISALFDVGDEFKNEERTSNIQFNKSSFSIVSRLLKREADLNSRHNLLKVSIESSRAFSMPTYHVTGNMNDWDKSRNQSEFPENYDQKLGELKEICLRRIQEASRDGRLRTHPDRFGVLQIWAGWTSTEDVAQWVRQEIQDRTGLFSFVGTFRNTFSNVLETTEYIVHERLKEFIPIQEVERKLEEIPPEELSEAEIEIINMFYQGKEEG